MDESRGRSEAVETRAEPWDNTAVRLEHALGLGDDPVLRRELYSRCERACQVYGAGAYRILNQVYHLAQKKDQPDRYFAKVVIQRLEVAGFLDEGRSSF